jgi:hypothetical protein
MVRATGTLADREAPALASPATDCLIDGVIILIKSDVECGV